jgi:chromosome segregation ATPase
LATVKDEVAELREENRQIKTALSEKDDEIAALREEIAALDAALGRTNEDALFQARRLTALETPAPPLREETASAHLDRLFSEMRRLRMRQTTVRDAARFIGISKPHMQKLKPYLAADMRFTLLKDPNRPNRYLIRIV